VKRLSFLLACTSFLLLGQNGAETVKMQFDYTNQQPAILQNGHVISVGPDNATITLLDQSGKWLWQKVLQIPGAVTPYIAEVAVIADGRVVVCASAKDEQGRSVTILAYLNNSGDVSKIVRTTPYAPNRMIPTRDGRVITFGRVHDEQFRDAREDYAVMRIYSMDGELLRSALPRSQFSTGRQPPEYSAVLAAGEDRIAFFDVTFRRYTEIDFDGRLLMPWQSLTPEPNLRIMSMAITSQGVIACIANNNSKSLPREMRRLRAAGAASLSPVMVTSAALPKWYRLIGASGDDLVFQTDPSTMLRIPAAQLTVR
jgi:hypothetical protein